RRAALLLGGSRAATLPQRGPVGERDLRRQRTPAAPRHTEPDALTGPARFHSLRQCRGADVDVLTLVLGQEAEALLDVVPLHLAGRHRAHLLLESCAPQWGNPFTMQNNAPRSVERDA